MSDEAMPCRACDGALEEIEVAGRAVWMCRACGGALVEQRDLVPVLHDAAEQIAGRVDFDSVIPPVPAGVAPQCPDCDGLMKVFGYMGTNLVHPARCAACALIWMGPDVLGGMTLLYARTNLRQEAHVAHLQEEYEGMNRRMTVVVVNRVRSSWMI